MLKKVTAKQGRYIQSYLYQNQIHTGTLWAALSLEFQKQAGFCGSDRDIEINLTVANWQLYEEIKASQEFKEYLKYLHPVNKKRKKKR